MPLLTWQANFTAVPICDEILFIALSPQLHMTVATVHLYPYSLLPASNNDFFLLSWHYKLLDR